MIKVIHTADIHFGMENYGKIDPETGIHTRLLDFEKALNFCIDYAIEQEVDLFLFQAMRIKQRIQHQRNKNYLCAVYYDYSKRAFRLLLLWEIMIIL
ncbi:MAG: hypothetical protein LVQ75_01505 [Candidatus Babeliales bacterium]|jgi:exonuclease SbcD